MKRLLCLALLACTPIHASALIVFVEPQPFWAPSPTPTLSPLPTLDPALPSPTPDLAATATLTPTQTVAAVLSPAPAPELALLPFEDRRGQKLVFKGRAKFQDVEVRAQDFDKKSAAWKRPPYGDMSLLWQHQLAHALAESGIGLLPLADPADDEALGQGSAADQGARFALSGKLSKLDLEKRGADIFFGTSFSGFMYIFRLEAKFKLVRLSDRVAVLSEEHEFEMNFHDDKVMGSSPQETFPLYFREGLKAAAQDFIANPKLRGALGHALFTPTPTVTATPTKAPTLNPKARTATITPTPTPASYYMNPNTGKAVAGHWNFDPEDGTPRKDFVLVDSLGQPMVTPTPTPTKLP